MSHPVPLAIPQVRNLIRTAEAKADEALLAKVELMQGMLRVRQSADVPAPHTGQEGLLRLGRAIQTDLASQSDLFRAHSALTKAAHEIWADAPHDDTPDYVEPTGEASAVA